MWDELENGLAWFKAAPARWVQSGKDDLSAAAEWLWTVLQGDFAEEQSTAQTITGTVISMVPLVDQICDIRDVVANCKKIHQDSNNKAHWLALGLTLLGLFPTLGSLAKGCFKILFAYGRKGVFKVGVKGLESGLWQATKPWVETGIGKLNQFLARPEVVAALKALHWDNVYKELARLARELAAKVNTGALTKIFDEVIKALTELLGMVQKWGTAAMQTKAGELLKMVKGVRDQANKKLGEVLKPIQDWLNQLARRLEVEADMNYRAYTNALNPHAFKKPTLDAEIAVFKTDKPKWVDVRGKAKYAGIEESPSIPPGYPNVAAKDGPLTDAFNTFHDMAPMDIAPGTTLYRVIAPNSKDNSICWMTYEEYSKLKSKDDWRRHFAVWANWNSNGEFVTYVVPPGKPLKVWEGMAASQELRDAAGNAVSAGAGGKKFFLEGGGRQIVLDPADLQKEFLGKRQPTHWGYSNFGETMDMVGVPTLTNNWAEGKK